MSLENNETSSIDVKYLMRALIKYNASDLHLKADRPPLYRINGKIVPAKMPAISKEALTSMILSVLSQQQKEILNEKLQTDFSVQIGMLGRFRWNVFFQKGEMAAVVRMIPLAVPKLEQLGLPSAIKELCFRKRGLVLVAGPTGSGKSTTLSGLIQYINEHRYSHILTIEDPIEYVFKDDKSTITQREIGADARTFAEALKSGLRQDPDVIVVGELQDLETIKVALTAAETGHLVFATLHTNNARSTIERMLDVFPAEQQNQVRIQIASCLTAVISQQLLNRSDSNGRVLASEYMVKSPMIENLIMKNEIEKIQDAIENSSSYYKMQSFHQDLERLVNVGVISLEEALKASSAPDDLKLRLSGIKMSNPNNVVAA